MAAAIAVVWIYDIIMTEAGVYDNSSANTQAYCRTDQSSVLRSSLWFRFQYPGQWGTIIFTWSSTFTMLAGALSAMVRSLWCPRNLPLCHCTQPGMVRG